MVPEGCIRPSQTYGPVSGWSLLPGTATCFTVHEVFGASHAVTDKRDHHDTGQWMREGLMQMPMAMKQHSI